MTGNAVIAETLTDWAAACEVQRRFLERPDPAATDTLTYSARCRQLRELGGDCYDFVPLRHHRLALAVADASGKGLAAALMISNVQSSVRTAAAFAGNDAAAVVAGVNRQLHAASLADRYATLFYGVFDGTTRTLRYVNAGHNPPVVIRRDGSLDWLEAGGLPVGIFPDSTYEQGAVQLHAGDLIVAYTDGLVEAVNPAGDQWGVDGLLMAAKKSSAHCADDVVDAIFAAMDEFSRGSQSDDATVVAVRVQ